MVILETAAPTRGEILCRIRSGANIAPCVVIRQNPTALSFSRKDDGVSNSTW
jgi:hypothetical protein